MKEQELNFLENENYDIAIIGMSARFPKSPDLETYWKNLVNGVECISFFEDDELEVSLTKEELQNPAFVRAAGIINEIEYFDADFFSIAGREATWMDPQQRLFLESAWTAFENAGYNVETYEGSISVYGGTNTNFYLLSRLEQLAQNENNNLFQLMLANEKDFLATRVAYKFNLKGESITVQTSCSTSLVAVHLACQSLLSFQSDMSLAGGVSIRVPQKMGYFYQEGMIASPDGHCRAFDEKAKGTVPGSGVGIVILKRLGDAVADGDKIYAVIRGSAINNDGQDKVGFTAPSIGGQSDVISKAMAIAGVRAETIDYVEAHGTGTSLGDPIEISALEKSFRRETDKSQFCAIGSVKTNLGHLDNAAGIAGLIKTVLSLHNRVIPPSLHFEKPNPAINFETSPFFVCQEATNWEQNGHPRRAGVSSFGIGGTNAHLILEEFDASESETSAENSAQLLTISGKTPVSAAKICQQLADFLEKNPETNLRDAAFTQNIGRAKFPHQIFAVGETLEEICAELTKAGSSENNVVSLKETPQIAFFFSGQGSQTINMASELFRKEKYFREEIVKCGEILKENFDFNLTGGLFAENQDSETGEFELRNPSTALPVLFSIQYGLAQTLIKLGIKPNAVCGHSFGEYAAAAIAGIFSLEDGLKLAFNRGKLMEKLPPGTMTAVRLTETEILKMMPESLSLASINTRQNCVVSGNIEEISQFEQELRKNGTGFRRLKVNYAYHSKDIELIKEDFEAIIGEIELNPPKIQLISGLNGEALTEEQALSGKYWFEQMRQTVRFTACIEQLLGSGFNVFLETAPGQSLTPMLKQQAKGQAEVIPLLSADNLTESDGSVFWRGIGKVWQQGGKLNWTDYYKDEKRKRISLPTYPFERKRYWVDLIPKRKEKSGDEQIFVTPDFGINQSSTEEKHILQRNNLNDEFKSPTNANEEVLIRLWEDILQIEGIGINDNFYELGGDSLIATQIFARIKSRFASHLTLKDFMSNLTVGELAKLLENEGTENNNKAVRNIEGSLIQNEAKEGIPLSFAQERLWLISQLNAESPMYNLPAVVKLKGDLDVPALEKAYNQVIERQASLRTTFYEVDGVPKQKIADSLHLTIRIEDLSQTAVELRDNLVRQTIEAKVTKLFDLEKEPAHRFELLKISETEHIGIFVIHHIISDAWSMNLFFSELGENYRGLVLGQLLPLVPLPFQYTDYAYLQRNNYGLEKFEQQIRYWKKQLRDAPTVLNLPLDMPRTDKRSFNGTTYSFAFDVEINALLQEWSRRSGVSKYMVLLAAFAVLLGKICKQEDVIVGAPIAGRNLHETEQIIGCFINTLPIRIDLSGKPVFEEVVNRIKDTALEAYSNQDIPFEKILDQLKLERSAGYLPLVQVIFDFLNTPPSRDSVLPNLELELMAAEIGTAKNDLVFDLWESSAGVAGTIEYNTDIFKPATIGEIAADFKRLTLHFLNNPNERIHKYEIATKSENFTQTMFLRQQESVRKRFERRN